LFSFQGSGRRSTDSPRWGRKIPLNHRNHRNCLFKFSMTNFINRSKCVYAYMRICVYAYIHIHVYVYMRICVYAYIHIYVYAHMRIYVYAYMRICAIEARKVFATRPYFTTQQNVIKSNVNK